MTEDNKKTSVLTPKLVEEYEFLDLVKHLQRSKRELPSKKFDSLFAKVIKWNNGIHDEHELREKLYGKKLAKQQNQSAISTVRTTLTTTQKLRIHEEERHTSPRELAQRYSISLQQARRIQRGEFARPKATEPLYDDYGPLTLEQKIHIRDHRSTEPTAELAKEYQTNYGNVKLAQQGKFKEPQSHRPNYKSILDSIPEEEIRRYLEEKDNA